MSVGASTYKCLKILEFFLCSSVSNSIFKLMDEKSPEWEKKRNRRFPLQVERRVTEVECSQYPHLLCKVRNWIKFPVFDGEIVGVRRTTISCSRVQKSIGIIFWVIAAYPLISVSTIRCVTLKVLNLRSYIMLFYSYISN